MRLFPTKFTILLLIYYYMNMYEDVFRGSKIMLCCTGGLKENAVILCRCEAAACISHTWQHPPEFVCE